MLSCMTFVFCSLLELAWVGYLSREEDSFPKQTADKANNTATSNNFVDLKTTTVYENNSIFHR